MKVRYNFLGYGGEISCTGSLKIILAGGAILWSCIKMFNKKKKKKKKKKKIAEWNKIASYIIL